MFVTSVSQLSVATGNIASAAASPATSLHSRVTSRAPAAVVHVGAVVSMIVIVCVYTALTLPHASVTVHVFVYVPASGQVIPATYDPVTFTMFVTSVSQLSVATGNIASAAAR